MPPFIDAHVHVWTDDGAKYPRAAGQRDYPPARFTPADLFVHTKPAGVTRIVLIQMSFYRFDNSYMLDSMRAHPGVFSGVGIVDFNGPDPAKAMKDLAAQGVRGFRLVGGNDFEKPGIETMWRTGAEENLAMCMLLGPDALPALDKMCARYPQTPVVIDHFARIGADGTIRDADIRALSALARHPLVKVKASAFYALGKKQAPYTDLKPLFRRVFEDFGPRRVMWASDCPFQVGDGHRYAPSLALITEQMPFLSADDRDWVLRRTAEATFFAR
jgi:predicted TIM-barrel fold metal-dependent hydrolase